MEEEEVVIWGYEVIELGEKKRYLERGYVVIYGRLGDGMEYDEFEEEIW